MPSLKTDDAPWTNTELSQWLLHQGYSATLSTHGKRDVWVVSQLQGGTCGMWVPIIRREGASASAFRDAIASLQALTDDKVLLHLLTA